MFILNPLALRIFPIEAAVIPFPRPESTPPVTKTYLIGCFDNYKPLFNLYNDTTLADLIKQAKKLF
jgi:hypothetical protein